jgi:hypothetical protein
VEGQRRYGRCRAICQEYEKRPEVMVIDSDVLMMNP